MFLEYVMDMSFVLIALIGSIVALLFVYVRKTNKKRVR
ncbi:putative membrane protein [Bacillus methanolicus MGA3]|uniref:Putative membrane protein n=1 Tax=Bacillus methanolicus (strain MGA3 / ATCC 53907) TaxID=796606 RepID=A0A068LMP3_BACMM|nr:putative membrane protein [Bacillus methanolicus MGA3]